MRINSINFRLGFGFRSNFVFYLGDLEKNQFVLEFRSKFRFIFVFRPKQKICCFGQCFGLFRFGFFSSFGVSAETKNACFGRTLLNTNEITFLQ